MFVQELINFVLQSLLLLEVEDDDADGFTLGFGVGQFIFEGLQDGVDFGFGELIGLFIACVDVLEGDMGLQSIEAREGEQIATIEGLVGELDEGLML